MPQIKHTSDQNKLIDTFWKTTSTLICVAPPGCGKTTVLQHIVAVIHDTCKTEAVVNVAPTGIATHHMPMCHIPKCKVEVQPMTLARLLKCNFVNDVLHWNACLGHVTFVHVVIDEFPMVDAEQFDLLLKQLAVLKIRWRLVLIGDPCQLPAVGISIFNSRKFQALLLQSHTIVPLTTQVRFLNCPTGDMLTFCTLLRKRHVNRSCMYIQERFLTKSKPPPGGAGVIYLTYCNAAREQFVADGLMYSHNVNKTIVYSIVTPAGRERFTCGPVMITKNNKENRSLVNGRILQMDAITGTPSLQPDPLFPCARVLKSDKQLCMHLIDDHGNELTLKATGVQINAKIVHTLHATQAFAITKHKAQGLTLSKTQYPYVIIDLDKCPSFEALFVACTRAQEFNQIHFLPIDLDRIANMIRQPMNQNAQTFVEHVCAHLSTTQLT